MKNGTLYAKRVRKLFSQLKGKFGKPEEPEPTDPVEQLIIGVIGSRAPTTDAVKAAKALRTAMVDINEVRVSTPTELSVYLSPHVDRSLEHAEALRDALNAIFRKENAVTLEHLRKIGRREARQYLEKLNGVTAAAAASVLLWSLGGHAIPVDRRLYDTLLADEMIDPTATLDEVQAFLERNISASDAKVFCLLMEKYIVSRKSLARELQGKSTRPARERKTRKKPATRASTGKTRRTASR